MQSPLAPHMAPYPVALYPAAPSCSTPCCTHGGLMPGGTSRRGTFCRWGSQACGLLLGLMVISSLGCEIPAQMVWSPDGTHAAYRCGNTAYLINEQGNVLR